MNQKAFTVILTSLLFWAPLRAEPVDTTQTKRVRLSWQEFEKDSSRVQSLRAGVAEMRRRNNAPRESAEYRTSWEYWAAMHGYFTKSIPGASIEDDKKRRNSPMFAGFYQGLKEQDPPEEPKGLGAEVWGKCQHSPRDGYNPYFFAWHRMFLFFFERVLRTASGDDKLTLPYWDYSNIERQGQSDDRLAMPLAFLDPQADANGIPQNPLHDDRRTAALVATALKPEITSVDPALGNSDFDKFQLALEKGVHSNIHCVVGNDCRGPIMGVVGASANDPIFWLHHANIDRIWECWTAHYGRAANRVRDADWMNTEFAFVDEKGDRVTMAVRELFDSSGRIDYLYDNTTKCSRDPLPPPVSLVAFEVAPRTRTVVASRENVAVMDAKQVVHLPGSRVVGGNQKVKQLKSLDEQLSRTSPATAAVPITRARLELRDLTMTAAAPMIDIFLKSSGSPRRVYVATISFFGSLAGDDHHQAHDATRSRTVGLQANTYQFDVTAAVRELSPAQPATAGLAVEFEATTGLQQRSVTPELAAAMQAANIRVGHVVLSVETVSGRFPLQ